MTITCKNHEEKLIIHLSDKFDFSEMEEFKSTYEDSAAKNYIVDFGETNYMDSSGLGMLLNMKRAKGDNPIELINCKDQIKKVLVVSRFDEHFNII